MKFITKCKYLLSLKTSRRGQNYLTNTTCDIHYILFFFYNYVLIFYKLLDFLDNLSKTNSGVIMILWQLL